MLKQWKKVLGVINKQSSMPFFNLRDKNVRLVRRNEILLSISLLQNKQRSIILNLLKTILLHYLISFRGRKFNCKITAVNFCSVTFISTVVVLCEIIIKICRKRKLSIIYHVTRSDQSEAHRILRSFSDRVLRPVFQGKLQNP